MTAPPMKYADAPGMERSADEIRPPAEDSATASVSLRATRRAATDAEREESFSGIVLGTSLGSEPAHCASGAERVSNRRTFRVVDLLRMTKQDGDDVPERKILYEDPDLGFCILAHVYHGAKESAPHDHGPTWAIYGQAAGETLMNEWALVEPASEQKPGKVRHVRAYPLKRGMAHVYNEGDLHSPKREGSTRLIRIEGRNMDKVKRLPYEKV